MNLNLHQRKSAMQNLWKKESNQTGAQYNDIFAGGKEDAEEKNQAIAIRLSSAGHHKINQLSTAFRKRGNDIFADRQWPRAMKLYTQALCYAELGCEDIALAYSNRSACFFHMKMYDEIDWYWTG